MLMSGQSRWVRAMAQLVSSGVGGQVADAYYGFRRATASSFSP